MVVRIATICLLSSISSSTPFDIIEPVSVSLINLSQYNVSRASLHDIETLWVKSGLVGEAWASSILAPMDVADRNSWLLRTLQLAPSFTKLLQNRTIRVASLNVLSHISCLIFHFQFYIFHSSHRLTIILNSTFFISHSASGGHTPSLSVAPKISVVRYQLSDVRRQISDSQIS